ncbi:zinc finger protein 530 isoform X4 [Sitodiplosis mosellana]|uniref:zinc finger protein 530 isoform X4 n=1 Tax=Sitodiplosis mosellana TaxID=263140 RepID=UPI0024442382|nr:zinc finger protein 530 isoform X4 [Sitodiplosis mosellana]
MAAQSNPPASFGYTWGFADNSRSDGSQIVEISPNINYTVSDNLTDGGITVQQKDVKGAIAHTNKGVVRRMFVVNEPFSQASTQSGNFRVITGNAASSVGKKHDVLSIGCDKNYQTDHSHTLANGILDNKTQTVLTSASKNSSTFMSSIGTLQLTPEECNEILMKRAAAAAQHQNHTTITTTDGQHTDFLIREGISVQVQKVIQGLEDADDSQATSSTHCKLEPVLEINPKEEILTAEEHEMATGGAPKERPYACEECGKSFLLKHHLTTHARVHTGERPHVCVHCGKSFAHKHCLNTHLLLHSTDRPYQCSECKKSFTLKHHLLTHSRVHSRERPFICQECGRSFPLKRHLVTHSKFHAGERPYVCDECGESFAQENHLIMHSRFHGSLNPFVCSDCGATFPRKFQLVNHGRIHGRVPHSCTVCGKEFLQKRTLVAHMRLHTGDQPYPCTACGEGFRTKAELNQHNRATHGGINPNSANTTIVVSGSQQQQMRYPVLQHQPQTVTVVSQSNNGLVTTITSPETSPRPQYACRECGQAFNSREALALHLRLHTGDKSLMTDLCALTAALPGHFLSTNTGATVLASNHSVVQQTPVPVQILSSGQVVQPIVQNTQHHQQQQHHQQHQMVQHHNNTGMTELIDVSETGHQSVVVTAPQQKPKTHFCTSCGKGFAAKHGLLQHNRRHPNGGCTLRTHVCECGKAFFQKNHLMLHQRQHLETKPSVATLQQQAQQQQIVVEIPQDAQNQQLQTQQQAQNQAQQAQNQQNNQQLTTREVLIGNQPVHVQVLQGNTAQVIKYEINIPQESQQIE